MAIRKVWRCFAEDGASRCPALVDDLYEEQEVIEHIQAHPTHVVIEMWKETQ